MKTTLHKAKFLFLASLIIGCTTQKKAVNYFAQHPSVFAKACAIQFPVKTDTNTITVPGPTIWVDCDSVVNATPGTPEYTNGSLTNLFANAPGNTTTGRRHMVPVNCPPSTTKTITVENTAKVEAAKAETETQRTRAEKAETNAALESQRAHTALESQRAHTALESQRAHTANLWLRRLIILMIAYAALRFLKGYISKIPVIGIIARFIV